MRIERKENRIKSLEIDFLVKKLKMSCILRKNEYNHQLK